MPDVLKDVRRNKNLVMVLGVALTLATLLLGRLAKPLAPWIGLSEMLTRTIVRSLFAVVFMVVLGGASWFKPDLQKVRDTWRYARPLVLINIVIATIAGAVGTLVLLFAGEFSGEQLKNLAYITVLCIFVGINEESMFRGLMFGGLLAGMGGRRGGPLAAAVISSFAFGFVHVMTDINYGDAMSILQGLFKTLETGMLGFVLCASVLEGRNMVGAITVHSFLDWVLLLHQGVNGTMPTATYVTSDHSAALSSIFIYVVFCALYLPKTIESIKRLRAMPLPQFGPFVPEEESARPLVAAPKAEAAQAQGAGQDQEASQAQTPENASPTHLRKERAHKVLDHKLGVLLATFIVYLMVSNLFSLVGLIIFGSGLGSQMMTYVCSIAVSVAFLLGYQRFFANEFDGVTTWSTLGLLLAAPSLVLAVPNVVGWFDAKLNNPLVCLVMALAPGFSEEIIFRAIPCSNWMRVSGERPEIIKCVAVSSAAFALVHGLNLFSGAALSATLFQMFYAFCLGVMFSVVLLRTGCIWGCIIMHAIIDFTSFLTMDMEHMGVLSTELTLGFEFWWVMAASIAVVAWGAYLLRPDKQNEIVVLWKRKWHKA